MSTAGSITVRNVTVLDLLNTDQVQIEHVFR